MIIASIKYGNKRIGCFGIKNYTCIANAETKLKEYLGDRYQYQRFLFGTVEYVTGLKNYEQDELFKIID